jgi:hypothetical protein
MIPRPARRFMSKRAGSTVVEVARTGAVTLIEDAAKGPTDVRPLTSDLSSVIRFRGGD